jgi:ADP-heptose:LPS heptosyltransferase
MKSRNIKRVTILNPGAGFGDHIMTLPLIRLLLEACPEATVDLLTNAKTRAMMDLLPPGIHFVGIQADSARDTLFTLIHYFRHQKSDAVIYLGKSTIISWLLRVFSPRFRIGYAINSWSRFCFTSTRPLLQNEYMGNQHFALGLELLKHLDLDLPEPGFLLPRIADCEGAASSNALAMIAQMAELNGPKILIHPGFSLASQQKNYLKAWPTANWKQLISAILEQYPDANLYLLGGPDDAATLKALNDFGSSLSGSLQSRIFNLEGYTSTLSDFAAIMQQGTLLVSVDSFPMHLAVSLNLPCVAIFASTNEQCYLPEDKGFRVATRKDLPCRPCLWTTRNESCETPVCLDVPVEVVLAEVADLLNKVCVE